MKSGQMSLDRDQSGRIKRAHALPLPVGTSVRLQGRVKECADLIESGGRRLLDIGCSSGWLGRIAMDKGFAEYVGIDRAIVGARSAASTLRFVEGSVFNLPFDIGSFDAVCMFDVIEHLPRGTEALALGEAYRVVSPRGRLYFSTPHASPLHSPLDPAWLLGHRHYRRATIRKLLEAAGFSVTRMFVAGGTVEALDHIRHLAYKHLLHRENPPARFIDRLIQGSHSCDHVIGMTLFAVASRASK